MEDEFDWVYVEANMHTTGMISEKEIEALIESPRCRQCGHSVVVHGATRLTDTEFAKTCNLPECRCIE